MKNNLDIRQQKIKAADAAFEVAQALLRKLKTSWEDGSTEMAKGQFQVETERLEEEISNLLVAKATMHAHFQV
ncbi:hypothetical protein O1611_g543 [Lasiodiplodia mahajangana]|uniref:Uncharacterized protein n=1 Tax=Lasiodiplodia mahajangana TaxID=1108764 RepID=A0ACC2JZW7_9PEZI|nr:hypothetical protein O1611_g543 [Lasiodiplodia mahajangana]